MFTSDQRKGFVYCFYRRTATRLFICRCLTQTVSPKKQEWLAMQSKIDSIKHQSQNIVIPIQSQFYYRFQRLQARNVCSGN
jgi:hypothetical protein